MFLKKYKQLIIGICIGSMLFGGVSFAEQVVKQATMNTQTISVDGRNVDLNFANIDGYNYIQLRSIIDAIGGDVAYDQSTQAIQVSTIAVTELTDANGIKYIEQDGVKYVSLVDLGNYCWDKGFNFNFTNSSNNEATYILYRKNSDISTNGNVEFYIINKTQYLTYDFTINTVLKFIEQN